MKVYERKKFFDFPEDMKEILCYLRENGTIYVDEKTIEKLYYEFSDDQYAAGWMCVDEKLLDEFANWLEGKEF